MSETLTEALDRLARAGFARRLERVGGALWCASCEVSIEPDEIVVEEVVEVTDRGKATGATLYALRCPGCSARGVWVVSDPATADKMLLEALRRSDPSRPQREGG